MLLGHLAGSKSPAAELFRNRLQDKINMLKSQPSNLLPDQKRISEIKNSVSQIAKLIQKADIEVTEASAALVIAMKRLDVAKTNSASLKAEYKPLAATLELAGHDCNARRMADHDCNARRAM